MKILKITLAAILIAGLTICGAVVPAHTSPVSVINTNS